jgi:flagellar basal-body rod protein FlgB
MNATGLTLFQRMEQRLHWLASRQTVLSQNIANADTPGYVAKELKPLSFGDHMNLQLASTSAGHLGGTGQGVAPVVVEDEAATETGPDGNRVSLEDQMMKIADNGMEYQAILNLYRKQYSMLKTALGRGTTA